MEDRERLDRGRISLCWYMVLHARICARRTLKRIARERVEEVGCAVLYCEAQQ
jgi:hypothetical protein